ncbi:MAG TPA: helix-turn-helix domain-containing protein, partial [Kofleriaceae bacterium]
TLVIPPLRERPLEIRPLAQRFLQRAARRHELPVPNIVAEAEAWIASHAWPGNVRELRHVMERALLLAGSEPIDLTHLPTTRREVTPPAAREVLPAAPTGPVDSDRARTLDALDRCHGNQTRAARMLGIARSTLLKRLDLYNVPRPRKA